MFAKQYYLATVLCHAIQQKNARAVCEFLEMGADPNFLSDDDSSPIHVASGSDAEGSSFVSSLLKYNGNPNLRNSSGLTPVHVAAACDNWSVLQLLLSSGGDPHQSDDDGRDAFAWAQPRVKRLLEEFSATAKIDRKLVEKAAIQTIHSRVLDRHPQVDFFENPEPFKVEALAKPSHLSDLGSWLTQSSDNSTYTTVTKLSDFSRFNSRVIFCESSGCSLVETHVSPFEVSDLFSEASNSFDWKSVSHIRRSSSDVAGNFVPVPPEIMSMTNGDLRTKLMEFGESPGPVVRSTRKTLELKLASYVFQSKTSAPAQTQPEFLAEVNQALSGALDGSMLNALEDEMTAEFVDPDPRRNWREGTQKVFFNYLLLDPRVTQNLPLQAKRMTAEDAFRTFLLSVFYVGKGRQSRPYEHFKEALAFHQNFNRANEETASEKVRHILDIWNCGKGVVSLCVFQNTIAVEAFTREASMIDALGLDRLTNQCRGQYYGPCDSWSGKRKRLLGAWLLKRALGVLLHEGERQIRPQDV